MNRRHLIYCERCHRRPLDGHRSQTSFRLYDLTFSSHSLARSCAHCSVFVAQEEVKRDFARWPQGLLSGNGSGRALVRWDLFLQLEHHSIRQVCISYLLMFEVLSRQTRGNWVVLDACESAVNPRSIDDYILYFRREQDAIAYAQAVRAQREHTEHGPPDVTIRYVS